MIALDLINKENTALLVIDKQKGYIDSSQPFLKMLKTDAKELEAAISSIDNLINTLRSQKIPIVWTRMIEDPELSPKNISLKMKLANTPSISRPGTESFNYYGEEPKSGDKVIEKKYYNAFAKTDLDEYLRLHGITNLIFVGGYVSKCILGTMFAANSLDYNLFVIKELVGEPKSGLREFSAALDIIDSILGYIVSEQEVLDSLK